MDNAKKLRVGSRVRILEKTEHKNRCGTVIEAEDDREVANVLLDPPAADHTCEFDYIDLEVLD